MRKVFFLILTGILTSPLFLAGQVVTCEPVFPTASDSIRIIFNANEGSRGLAGFAGPIWAHTGLITDQSTSGTDWRYVIAGWSVNLDKAKLKSLGNNLWELKIGPSIRSFYGVPSSVKILKLAFVFRNQDGSKQGKATGGSDIFQDVYEPGLNLVLLNPVSDFLIVEPGQEIPVHATTSESDSIVLLKDGIKLTKSITTELTFNHVADSNGLHKVEVVAFSGIQTARDSFQYYVKGADFYQELPPGVKDGINYPDAQSAILVLFAPEKEYVFVIGNFTDWKVDPKYLMNKTPDQKRYWIKIENLNPGQEYLFQYLVDGEINIADPYSDKISDPWNDGYIDTVTYPDLIAFPKGKTTQAVTVLQTAQIPYSWKSSGFVAPPKEKLVIYELLVRDFLQAHSFNALINKLSYLKELGVNAIELMPVSEFEGNDSWGYNPSFYFAVDKYYGPKDTFKSFIDAAHQMGLAVIMDMVLNHTYGQSPMVRLYWDSQNSRPAANNPWYNIQSPNTTYSWGYDFNHESIYTQQFVDSVNSYWLKEYQIDGFRFDFTKGFTNTSSDGGGYDAARIRILKRMYDHILTVNSDAFVILEHFAANSEEKELSSYGMMIWGNSNYNYLKATSSYFLDGKSDFSWISWQKRGWTEPNLVGYMESHDEERLMYECYYWGNMANPAYPIKDTTIALQRMELDANFFIPIPGPKMIWMFGELGYDYSINFNGRVGAKPVRWDYLNDYRRKRVYQVYSALNRLKMEYPVFSTSSYTIDFADTVKLMNLSDAAMNVAIIGNYGIRSSKGDPHFQHTGWWYEYWSGDSVQITDVNGKITFQPGEYHLYTDVKLDKPDIVSGTGDLYKPLNGRPGITIYPNPASDWLYIDAQGFRSGETSVRIFDLQGRQVLAESNMWIQASEVLSLDISGLDEGLYFIEVQSNHGKLVARWVRSRQ
ncbi:MAG: alpha-amylase family glycosyl hydrolase [Bacteroidia bacterium]|nr:alpha-amylase family glycosyl hydrolase [Bacteroidia bacterium]